MKKVLAFAVSLLVLGAALWGPMAPALADTVYQYPAAGIGAGDAPTWTGTHNFNGQLNATSTLKVYQTTDHTTANWLGLSNNGSNSKITTGVGRLDVVGHFSVWNGDYSAALWETNINTNRFVFQANQELGWSPNVPASSPDIGFTRAVAGVVEVNNGAAGGNGWLMQRAARGALAADYTNATAAFTNTNLSFTVISGRTYTFDTALFLQDSVAAEGAQIDFNGGTATATNFRVHCILDDTTTTITNSAQATALATAFSVATLTGVAQWKCHGTFVPSAAGTFIVRGRQGTHATGTLTIFRGSYLWIEDVPAL